MKKLALALAMSGACAIGASNSFAGNTDAYYNAETGRIVIPHLVIGDGTFYVTLRVADEATLTFVADLESVTDITAPAEIGDTVNLDANDIVGTWGLPDTTTTITFNSDGSYSLPHAPELDDDACPNGGLETGTYVWEPSTGILLSTTLTDENGECGLSNPRDGVPYRIFINGDSMQILEKGDGVPLEEFSATRQ